MALLLPGELVEELDGGQLDLPVPHHLLTRQAFTHNNNGNLSRSFTDLLFQSATLSPTLSIVGHETTSTDYFVRQSVFQYIYYYICTSDLTVLY